MASDKNSKDYLREDIKEVKQVCENLADRVHNLDKTMAAHKATFESHIENDRFMYEEFKRMNDILQQNTDSLREHMHRTNLLERSVQTLDQRLSPIEIEILKKTAVRAWLKDKAYFIAKVSAGIVSSVAVIKLLMHVLH